MKKLIQLSLLAIFSFMCIQCSSNDLPAELLPETVTDADGNVYNTIEIGGQIWMLENLKTTRFNNGEAIPKYKSTDDWFNIGNPASFYQWASTEDFNNAVDGEIPFDYYGAMYNEAAMTSGKLAPVGWRIPTEQDFMVLEAFLASDGHIDNEATVLKSASGWLPSNANGTDLYGFNGLPNGYVDSNGIPKVDGIICTWATSDVNISNQTRRIINLFDESTILYFDNSILLGAGIRCIKAQ